MSYESRYLTHAQDVLNDAHFCVVDMTEKRELTDAEQELLNCIDKAITLTHEMRMKLPAPMPMRYTSATVGHDY